MEELFREFIPIIETFEGHKFTIWTNIIGSALISVTFFSIGMVCIIMAGKNEEKAGYKKRKFLTQLFGLFLLLCGIARGIDLLSLWHNYALIDGMVKIMTGLVASAAIIYIPTVIRAIKDDLALQNLTETMNKTNENIEILKNINEDLNKNTTTTTDGS